jgi:hypothetical protein
MVRLERGHLMTMFAAGWCVYFVGVIEIATAFPTRSRPGAQSR